MPTCSGHRQRLAQPVYFAELVYAVEVAAQKAVCRSLLVINTHARRAAAKDPVAALAAQQVDGIVVAAILTTAEQHAPTSLDVPTVLIDQYRGAEEVASIGTDVLRRGAQRDEHLVGHGHSRIAFVGGDPEVDRQQGWVDALSAAGLALGPRYRVGFGWRTATARACAWRRSRPGRPPCSPRRTSWRSG